MTLLFRLLLFLPFSLLANENITQGFSGDYIFNRKLEVQQQHAMIRSTRLNTNAYLIGLRLYKRFELYSTLGASRLVLTTPASAFGQNNLTIQLETTSHFSWSCGLKADLYNYKCFTLGADANYFQANLPINTVINLNVNTPNYLSDTSCKYKEGTLDVWLSYRRMLTEVVSIIPYTALKFSGVKVNMGATNVEIATGRSVSLLDLQQQHLLGYAVGLKLCGYNHAILSGEARFANEKALHLSVSAHF